MRTLHEIRLGQAERDIILVWRGPGEALSEETVALPTPYAAAEALALLGQIRPAGRSEAMVRQVLKTVPKAPRQGRG